MSDAINPAHYKRLPAEAIEIIEAAIDNAWQKTPLVHVDEMKLTIEPITKEEKQ